MAKKMVTAKKTIGDANESTELAPADTATPGTASSAADAPAAEPMVPSSVADEIVLSLQTSAGPDIRADRTLFGCFDDVETCILGLCCPCALAAKNMYRAGLDGGQGWKRLFAGLVLFDSRRGRGAERWWTTDNNSPFISICTTSLPQR